MPAIAERAYYSQFSTPTIGLEIRVMGEHDDPDGNDVHVVVTDADGNVVVDRDATRESVGVYSTVLSSVETKDVGVYSVSWTWANANVAQMYETFVEIGAASPLYDSLSEGMRTVIENVYWRFADLFDSPLGGPHLQVYFQTAFGRGRMAQILSAAVGRLNSISQPHQSYAVSGPGEFPVSQWGGVLEQAVYVETIRHLRRSYLEQPDAEGVSLARLDRRSYFDKWGTLLREEEESLAAMTDVFKVYSMGLSGAANVLVSGGAYGSWGPSVMPGSAAPRGYWTRWM